MTTEEKTRNKKVVFKGPFFLLREHELDIPGPESVRRIVLEHPGAACALPLLPDGKIVMVRQYRKAIEQMTLELPAGKLEPGEDPAQCMIRELAEEIGYRPDRMELMLSYYPAFGYSNEIIHIYQAEGLCPVPRLPGDETYLEPEIMDLKTVTDMIDSGQIKDSKTIIGVLTLLRKKQELSFSREGINP